MRLNLFGAGTLALVAAFPLAARAADPPTPAPMVAPSNPSMPSMPSMPAGMLPFSQQPALASAHVWLIEGTTKRQLSAAQVQVAQSNIDGMGAGSMTANVAKSFATSALAIAGGPIGMVASNIFSMFGHHAPKPKYHAVLALGGPQSSDIVRTAAPAFELDYSDIPGINPDAYAPQILKLGVTKDNWRIVSVSTSSDPTAMAQFMMPAGMAMPNMPHPGSVEAPKLEETPVQGASVQTLGRGHARINLAQPLEPGEYGIVLRPINSSQDDGLQTVLRTVWDFSIPGASAQQ